MIKGIIPAAGRGSRLMPYPGNKETIPIGYVEEEGEERLKVIAEFVLESMIEAGAEVIYWIINHRKDDIIKYFGNGSRFGVKFVYLVQEEMVGMPQAINIATDFIKKGDKVLFGMPDTIFKPKDCFKRMSNKSYINTDFLYSGGVYLGTFKTERYWKFGMVQYSKDKVKDIIDKPSYDPETKWAWGNAVWGSNFQKFLNTYVRMFNAKYNKYQRELVLGDIFRDYMKETGKLKGYRFVDGDYFDIGTTGELKKTLDEFNK